MNMVTVSLKCHVDGICLVTQRQGVTLSKQESDLRDVRNNDCDGEDASQFWGGGGICRCCQ